MLLLSRLYEVTGQERWKTLVQKIVGLLITTNAWSETYGIYWSTSRTVTNNFPAGAYSAGVRVISPWMMGIITEGMAAAYRVTGEPELRRRMVKIAQFVSQYGPHPTDGFHGYLYGVNILTHERIWVETHGLSKTTPPKWTGAYSTAVDESACARLPVQWGCGVAGGGQAGVCVWDALGLSASRDVPCDLYDRGPLCRYRHG